ncbi:hypothetical protein NKDENANG_01057 [Candidatus Entotheonellaceae bacterium PAL068K]
MLSSKRQTSYRHVLIISVLIGSICFLTLTPAMYLAFHALQWQRAVQVVEAAFLPALLLSGAAGLLAYQRDRERQALLDNDEFHEERG